MRKFILTSLPAQLFLFLLVSITQPLNAADINEPNSKEKISYEQAELLLKLPLKCIDREFPYKPWFVITDSSFFAAPKNYHPAFYGCYDWHSCVHAHWLLVSLLKEYPNLSESDSIRNILARHLSKENILKELSLFKGENKTFEKIYGWAWILKLQTELNTWDDPLGKQLSENLLPLSSYLSKAWIGLLTKMTSPVREGQHYNLAFGLNFTWDYAVMFKDTALQNTIYRTATAFYKKDKNYPIDYEPGGFDFLSPALEEAVLMKRILPKTEYISWLKKFLPCLFLANSDCTLKACEVKDPTDGKLAHLWGLNFSRAACLYQIATVLPPIDAARIRKLANKFTNASLPFLLSGQYSGEHWLATFAMMALKAQ